MPLSAGTRVGPYEVLSFLGKGGMGDLYRPADTALGDRLVNRIATPANEVQLLEVARCGTAAHVEQLVRGWRRVDRIIAARETDRRHQQRQLEAFSGRPRYVPAETRPLNGSA